jgi:hypothetical protein
MLDSAKSTMDASMDKARTMGEAAKDRASDLVGHKGSKDNDKQQMQSMPHGTSKNSRS